MVVRKVIDGGVLKLERVQVTCPACGQQVEAVATDGRVKGYCAVAEQDVDFLIETPHVLIGIGPTAETRAKISAAIDLPPKKESSYNVSLEGQKRGDRWPRRTTLRSRSLTT